MTTDGNKRMSDIVDEYARAEIRSVRSEVHEIQNTLSSHGQILTEISATLKNNKPTGLLEIIKSGITLAVFIGSLVGGVAYVVNAMSEARLVLIEYRLDQVEKDQKWKTSIRD